MSVVWTPSVPWAGEPTDAQTTRHVLGRTVVLAAVLFNLVLCLVNTRLFSVGADIVIGAEISLIGIAFGLIFDRGIALYAVLLLLAAYFMAVMAVRADFDPKIGRDFLIPIVFYFLGRYFGSLRAADWLVTILILIALGFALFEYLAQDIYLSYFDIIHYYVARGTVTQDIGDAAGLFVSGTRPEPRTLLPFLGDHRVSGIFLEPVSVGNFGAIAFAWVLLRDRRRFWPFVAKTLAIAAILVLADARFGFDLSLLTLVLYLAAPIIRPTMLFSLPFLAMLMSVAYAGAHWQDAIDDTIAGRLHFSGDHLAGLDLWRVFGLQASDVFLGDAGYAYVLVNVGLIGAAAIWALFVYAPVVDEEAWRFKNFVAIYAVLLLCISTSLFTIKTAALLWFLYGTLNNPNRAAGWARVPALRLPAAAQTI